MTQSEVLNGHPLPTQCENCAAALQGEYCHACGQSVHSPMRHAGHALEEVFESFWHLDGRVFRTLRDLLVPGRTALQYLAGHRQRYLPPLRIFVIMSLLAFFVGKLTVHLDEGPIAPQVDVSAILESRTVEEVERNRDRMLAELEQDKKEAGDVVPGVSALIIASQVKIQAEAANRIVELTQGEPATGSTAPTPDAAPVRPSKGELLSVNNKAWNAEMEPVQLTWLPQFANAWLTRKAIHITDNLQLMSERTDRIVPAIMSSLPSALFVLVPLFALMLKLAYLFKRRLYLEHLVVALYSHAFLLMALTAVFVLTAVGGWVAPHAQWLSWLLNAATFALLAWMPVYLLLMQKRVYGQGWPMTILKYLVIGTVYVNLLITVAMLMFVVTLART